MQRLHLVDINPAVADALRVAFARWTSVDVQCRDILDVAFDTLVSPANSYGFMDGGIDLHYINVLYSVPLPQVDTSREDNLASPRSSLEVGMES